MPKTNTAPPATTAATVARREAFRQLIEVHGMDPDDPQTTGDEDAAEYLDGEKPLCRFCILSMAGEHSYAYADADTLDAAKTQAATLADDIGWGETVLSIVDLDTNEHWRPDFAALPWHLLKD